MIDETFLCSICGKETESGHLFKIDDEWVCTTCLYGDAQAFEIYPIGVVRNSLERSQTDFGLKGENPNLSRIELLPSQKRFMYRLEEEHYLTIVYYLHKSRPVVSVFNRGLDGKKVGVFASRTPDRLSRIGIQDVQLSKIEGTTLFVEGLDAVDKTPVIDIKLCWHTMSQEQV